MQKYGSCCIRNPHNTVGFQREVPVLLIYTLQLECCNFRIMQFIPVTITYLLRQCVLCEDPLYSNCYFLKGLQCIFGVVHCAFTFVKILCHKQVCTFLQVHINMNYFYQVFFVLVYSKSSIIGMTRSRKSSQ